MAAALALAGCAQNRYIYEPSEEANSRIAGYPAARYAIPPDAPAGDVLVASFGVTEARGEGLEPVSLLHVRFVVANESGDVAWRVDAGQVRVELNGTASRAPAFINGAGTGLPAATIPPEEERTLDFYYALPVGIDAAHVPAFHVTWTVQTDDKPVSQRTPFERLTLLPQPPPIAYEYSAGVARYWWHDPFFTAYAFVRPTPVVVRPRPFPLQVYSPVSAAR